MTTDCAASPFSLTIDDLCFLMWMGIFCLMSLFCLEISKDLLINLGQYVCLLVLACILSVYDINHQYWKCLQLCLADWKWAIYFAVCKLINPQLLLRKDLVNMKRYLSLVAIACLGSLEVSLQGILPWGCNNWMWDVKQKPRLISCFLFFWVE